jgi:hypothetical protein
MPISNLKSKTSEPDQKLLPDPNSSLRPNGRQTFDHLRLVPVDLIHNRDYSGNSHVGMHVRFPDKTYLTNSQHRHPNQKPPIFPPKTYTPIISDYKPCQYAT